VAIQSDSPATQRFHPNFKIIAGYRFRSGGYLPFMTYFPKPWRDPAANRHIETLRTFGNQIPKLILDDSGQMGIAIKESPYVSTTRGSRLENCAGGFSGFRDIDQREQVVLEVEKVAHQSENVLGGQRVEFPSLADSDAASGSAVLRKPVPQDGLKNASALDGRGNSGQAAEGALIDHILAGHNELFMDLIRPHQRTVYATVFSLLTNKEDAEDVAQDTLVKALARLHQFRKESTFGTWLVQIAMNEARMRNRKQWRVPMLSLTHNKKKDDEKKYAVKDFEDWREIPSTVLERAEIREALVKALDSLDQHYREVFVLRDIHDLSIAETSAILGISPGAVKSRLRRARLMLRDILAPGLGQDGRLGWAAKEVRKPWE
jgi:RNA polymerase sigma-70 factor (ECF subfamily)